MEAPQDHKQEDVGGLDEKADNVSLRCPTARVTRCAQERQTASGALQRAERSFAVMGQIFGYAGEKSGLNSLAGDTTCQREVFLNEFVGRLWPQVSQLPSLVTPRVITGTGIDE